MKDEIRIGISKVLMDRATYSEDIRSKWAKRDWERFHEFNKLVRMYDTAVYLVRRLPLITFGIGLLLGLWLGGELQ